jgi:bifunctional DNA-binding transcriptional regulator/antitoxin component of YhaV-PrlF toxin-antitoxin module
MASLMESKGQFTITIPKDVINATGWKKGDELYIGKKEEKNTLFIEKIEQENKKEKKKK